MTAFTRRENQILDILFEAGEATATQIRNAMSDTVADATVRTILRILEEKGAVTHRRDGKRYVYRPRKRKSSVGKAAIRRVLDVFFEGSLENALAAHFADSNTKLEQTEMDRLRGLIDEAQKKSSSKTKTKSTTKAKTKGKEKQ